MAFTEFETDSQKYFLHAVNVLLQMINEPPLENEEDISEVLEAQIAAQVINETKMEILSDDWDFNRDKAYELTPDNDGIISIPFNMLDLSSQDGDLIVRNWKLYSKSNQSIVFDEVQTVDVIWNVPFNDLTHAIRNYVTIAAARKFQARQVGDTTMIAYSEKDEIKARIVARRSDTRTNRYVMDSSQYGQTFFVSEG